MGSKMPMGMKPVVRAGLAMLLLAGLAAPGQAQLDYRNLDDDRPTLIEDAYPVERYAFEYLASWRYSRHGGNGGVHAFVPELEYGALPNFHLGVKLPIAGSPGPEGRRWGVAGLRVFTLYNFNTESAWLPALSVRADGSFPVGSLAGEKTRVSLKAIATRSFGMSRVHLNGAYTFGAEGALAAADAAHRWWAGAAVDRTLFRQSILVLAEVYALRSESSVPLEVNASAGLRYQWTPTMVLDLGVARRLRSEGPDLEVTIGLTRAFALAGLMPTGRR